MDRPKPPPPPPPPPTQRKSKLLPLLCNGLLLALGNMGGPLLLRLYFLHGGRRKWLTSWLETGGWPLVLLPLSLSYLSRRRRSPSAKLFLTTPSLLLASLLLGLLTGLDDYMYVYGSAYLPVSTSALLVSSHLAFTAVFAFLIVKHRFSPYSVNAVFLLTVGAAVLGLHSAGDRPEKEGRVQYWLGFFMTIGAALLYGIVQPLIQLCYVRTKQEVTYTLVLEMQTVMTAAATAFSTVGMLCNHDFKAIPVEARNYRLGEAKYYMVLVGCAAFWQFFFVGMVGVISCASSLHAAVIIASVMPVTETLGVILLHEKFTPEKGVSLVLSLWGFSSYFYGEWKKGRKTQKRYLDTLSDI